MADIIDQANDTADLLLAAALQNQQRAGTITPVGTGFCLYCAVPVPPPRRWCDAECRNGWEAEQR